MPSLLLDNVPLEIWQRLQQRAATSQRPLREEVLLLLQQALGDSEEPLTMVSTPCDLPWLEPGQPVKPKQVSPPLLDLTRISQEEPAPAEEA